MRDFIHVFVLCPMRILVVLYLLLSHLSSCCSGLYTSRDALRTSIALELQSAYTPRLNDDDHSQVAFDVSRTSASPSTSAVILQATPTTVYRPRNPAAYQHARRRSLLSQESERVEWEEVRILAPDVQDRHTLSQLARMTGNAYALPGRPNWYEIDPAWNTVRAHLPPVSSRRPLPLLPASRLLPVP